MGKLRTALYIAKGINTGDVCLQLAIHSNKTMFVRDYTGDTGIERCGLRQTPRGYEEMGGRDRLCNRRSSRTIGGFKFNVYPVTRHRDIGHYLVYFCPGEDTDSVLLEDLFYFCRNVRVLL